MKAVHVFPCVVVLCLVLGLLSGCGSEKQQQQAAQSIAVGVVTLAPQKVVVRTVLPGRTSAHLVSEVRPQVGGIIQKRLFREGSDVKQGQLLYLIDPAPFRATYENAKAALDKAVASLASVRLKAVRYANLIKYNGVSKQDNDDAQSAYRQARAGVEACRAALDSASINLRYTRVTAPISGRIGKSGVTPGALVTANQAEPLATIQQIDPMYVDVTQSSTEVARLRRRLASGRMQQDGTDGAKVKLLFDDGAQYGQEGVLQFSDITVDQTTGAITLRALFPNHGYELLPGEYVRAVVEQGVDTQALLVPQAAVMRDTKGVPQVLVVRSDASVEMRNITVGQVVGDQWLVTGGLAAGDRVVVEGLQKVKPGMKVIPREIVTRAVSPNSPAGAGAPARSPAGEGSPSSSSAPSAGRAVSAHSAQGTLVKPKAAGAAAAGPKHAVKKPAVKKPGPGVRPKAAHVPNATRPAAKAADSETPRESK